MTKQTTTPPDLTEQVPEPPDTIWLRHDGTFWHAVTHARLRDSPQYVRVHVNDDFTEQARQLVEQCVTDASHVPCDCEDLWCIHWKDKVSSRVASFAAEAATQGQATGIELAASYLDPAIAARCTCNGIKSHEADCEALTLVLIQNGIRAFSPEPDYLNRVRNEAIAKYFCDEHQKLLSESKVEKFVCFWCAQNKIAEREAETAREALEQAAQWRLIEAAPKEAGKAFLIACTTDEGWDIVTSHQDSRGNWIYEGQPTFCQGYYFEPKYWMPLPKPPIAAIGDDKEERE